MSRPSWDEYFMQIAVVVASRATCLRRAVGCVMVDERNRILAAGYNGAARGEPHCNERQWVQPLVPNTLTPEICEYPHACQGARGHASGQGLEGCRAIHAEQNALVQCRDVDAIATIYVTVSPCDACLKLLLSTGATRLVVGGWYGADREATERATRARWEVGGREVVLLPTPQ